MQSAAVPCTSNSNGIKRTAASALLTESTTSQQSNNESDLTRRMNQSSDSPPPPEKRSFIVVESPLKLETIASAVSFYYLFTKKMTTLNLKKFNLL